MELSQFVENYWLVSWDLSDKPDYIQNNLPHPSQSLVIDPSGKSAIFGIQLGKFSYHLKDKGRLFGIKFWPGAFHTFYNAPVSLLTNTTNNIADIFDVEHSNLEQQFLQENILSFTESIEKMLLQKQVKLTDKALLVRKIVEYISSNKETISVSDVAGKFQLRPRSLQRLFEHYIGVSPKWVIERYRIIEAVDTLNRQKTLNLTELAHRLGYFDQAHFSKVFSALVGFPPSHFN